ncbi:hypothetical protein BN7_6580 [Wickerhamomyces ciferrii]|uniref:C2 NT-type domain-containing protein n=1 Tax=Wickerhamomyces ciferrii (strain ATCC 14091 / BCRC 22168 / CBS 111 / JCM 3599 / NBRC 0793 / NRRL Y-1031 F-60-10) TaxID=1206466 RepID=K0L0K7_WICCF|nr:uncharacterized protein BN7_6580 [Wickerhamomyces ciferrii]CCH46973.1 hypothetical protein BN7_6580 [Wickerhamomyces ciferrii]
MALLSHSKRPKFLFSLRIQELANIPKVSGACYVKWYLKDSPTQQTRGRTQKVHIKDHRAYWGYDYEALVKLGINRNKLLQDKILVLIVYTENSHHHHHHQRTHSKDNNSSLNPNPQNQLDHRPLIPVDKLENLDEKLIPTTDQKTTLGKIEINLAEYVNYEEPTSNRYLLQQSKINCILNVKIGMELIKGEKSEFIAPSMKNSNVFKGISNVFNESSAFHESITRPSSAAPSHNKANSASGMSSPDYKNHKSTMAITSDPIVAKLYEKTFEISWDPRPGEFTAGESVDDIFNGGDGWAKNEEGINLIDLDIDANRTQNPLHQVSDYKGDTTTQALLKESDIREDLKSWSINHTLP